MALTWDLTNIENHEEVCFEWITPAPSDPIKPEDLNEDGQYRGLSGVTHGLIFATMSVGIGSITEDNCGEFAARLNLVQRTHGAMLVGTDPETGKRGPVPITAEDVFAHIGLVCNVSYKTHAQFIKQQVTEDYKRDITRQQKRYEESKSEAPA